MSHIRGKIRKGQKRGCCILLAVLFLWLECSNYGLAANSLSTSKKQEDKTPKTLELRPEELYSMSCVLMDADTGRILYGKEEEEFRAMASTTKIMTCILALEMADLEEKVTFSSYAQSMPKVKQYARSGETFRLEDLLVAMMLESYNDTAVAIAEHLGRAYGDVAKQEDSKACVAAFARMMNEKATELGCENTYFITPNGLDDSIEDENGECRSHGTTAADLARIMCYCVSHSPKAEEFLRITQIPTYSFCNEKGKSYSCTNHNILLQTMDGAESGKTGFTNQAGYCYVGSLKKGEHHLVVALLGCGWPSRKNDKWKDAKKLFSYGLEHYEYQETSKLLQSVRRTQEIEVHGGCGYDRDSMVKMYPNEKVVFYMQGLLVSGEDRVERRVTCPRELECPVVCGEKIGEVVYLVGGQEVCRAQLLAGQDYEKRNMLWALSSIMELFVIKS